MRTIWGVVVVALLAGCGGAPGEEAATSAPVGTLTGLYEGGSGPRRNQLCLIEREGRSPSFGFVLWGPGDRSCGARGIARRDGDRLRLLPDGDDSCALDARVEGDRIVFPGAITPECARYYCGEGVAMAEVTFARAGATEADARRAVDLAGDPLCGG